MTPTGFQSRRSGRIVRRGGALSLAAALAACTAALSWWGGITPAATQTDLAPVAVAAAAQDSVYVCPAEPGNSIGGVDLGQTSSSTTLTVLDGASSAEVALLTDPADPTELDVRAPTRVDHAAGGIVTVGPAGASAGSASGVIRTLTVDGDLRGLSTAPCVPPSTVSWLVGGSGAVGSSAELRLTNPGATTVTASLSLFGSTGAISMPTGGTVAVPAGQTVTVLLEGVAVAEPRLALKIEAQGGAIAAHLVTESLDGETPAGVDVLTPGAEPSTSVTVPAVELVEPAAQGETADPGTGAASSQASALRIVNPSQSVATVSVSMLGADGEQALAGATRIPVDPGAVFDISLAGVAPGTYGVHLTSDQPVAAAVRLVRSGGEYPELSGSLAHDVAWIQAQEPDVVSAGALTLPSEQAQAITSALSLTNTEDAPVEVSLTAADGSWSQEVTVAGRSTLSVEVPQEVSTLTMSAPAAAEMVAGAVVTAEVDGSVPGTLIAAVTPVADAAAASARTLLLR